jgi:hypothetical protein
MNIVDDKLNIIDINILTTKTLNLIIQIENKSLTPFLVFKIKQTYT